MEPVTIGRPTQGGERIVLIDALRGFALFGILMVNTPTYDFRFFRPEPLSTAERWSSYVLHYLCDNRFWPLFFFLFGVGAARLIERLGGLRYLRRLAVLFVLGIVHLTFIYLADILARYALVGIALLAFRRRSDRALVLWSGAFVVGGAFLSGILLDAQAWAPFIQRLLNVIDHGSYRDVIAHNLASYRMSITSFWELTSAMELMAPMLLGYAVGRRVLVETASQHLGFFRGLLVGGATIAVAFDIGLAVAPAAQGWHWHVLRAVVAHTSELATSCVYFAGIVLLWQRPGPRRVLAFLAPAGRMSLTNYISQNLIGLVLFYHLGLGLGPLMTVQAGIGFAIALWLVQVLWSRAWLRTHAFGPVEWLWRAATYGRLPPFRIEPKSESAPAR